MKKILFILAIFVSFTSFSQTIKIHGKGGYQFQNGSGMKYWLKQNGDTIVRWNEFELKSFVPVVGFGGGGSQTLQQTTTLGNKTTDEIEIINNSLIFRKNSINYDSSGSMGLTANGKGVFFDLTNGGIGGGIGFTIRTDSTNNPSSPELFVGDSSGIIPMGILLNGQYFKANTRSGTINLGTISAGGITSLNGLTGATQTFVNDANIGITSTGTTHTINWTGTLADGRIASAATWNAKQNAFANLTTFGNLANSSGLLRNNGAGVLSYDATAYATQQALADSMAGLSKFNINKDYDSLATTETNGDLTLHSIDVASGSTAITASKILGSRNNRYSVLFNPANVAMADFSGTITNSRISDFQSGVRNNISLTTTGTSGAATYNPTTGALNIPQYAGGGGQANLQFKDEGTNLGAAGTVDEINFTGTGVTSSRVGNAVTVNVPGGGATYTGSQSITLTGSNFTLTNDAASGTNLAYGFNNLGARGMHPMAVMNLTSPVNGDLINYQSGEWVNITPLTLKTNLNLNNVTNESKATMFTSPLFTTPRLAATSTVGHVWTATDASGNGSFQAPSGGGGGLNYSQVKAISYKF